jgi:23S rRNA (cytidine1920-2'-O)/16S rRNA (cytidine1409-2'-O)-methyltransferase
MKKERLDKLMVDAGIVKSRDRAKALIMAGKVLVDRSSTRQAS